MGSVISYDEKCPQCKKEKGFNDFYYKNHEEYFYCQADKCGFSYTYLWKRDKVIYISMVIIKPKQRGKGYLTKLMNSIEKHGFTIKVPVPLWKMKEILIKKGYTESDEYSEVANCKIEIWSK